MIGTACWGPYVKRFSCMSAIQFPPFFPLLLFTFLASYFATFHFRGFFPMQFFRFLASSLVLFTSLATFQFLASFPRYFILLYLLFISLATLYVPQFFPCYFSSVTSFPCLFSLSSIHIFLLFTSLLLDLLYF